MNTLPPITETPDELDRLFSDFFKAQLKRPWPGAPSTTSAEPSELAVARTAEAPRNQPRPATRDTTARARFTLAASVAMMFGTCLYLSNGFQPGERQGTPSTPVNGPKILMLPGSGADGDKHLPLQKLEEDKAKGNGGVKSDLVLRSPPRRSRSGFANSSPTSNSRRQSHPRCFKMGAIELCHMARRASPHAYRWSLC